MKFIICENPAELGEVVSELMFDQIRLNPTSNLCIPTGGTPIPAYQRLAQKVKTLNFDVSKVHFYNLDEYLGLPSHHEQSYQTFLSTQVLDPLEIQPSHRHLLRSDSLDAQAECTRNNVEIDAIGCFDLLMDGIGENGHIAFNEPSDHFEARTHIADISESTRIANARFFSSLNEVPHQAISVGFEDIMKSKMIILVATGAKKAPVINKLISETTINCDFPISFLRMHSNVIIVLDKLAYGSCLDQLTH